MERDALKVWPTLSRGYVLPQATALPYKSFLTFFTTLIIEVKCCTRVDASTLV